MSALIAFESAARHLNFTRAAEDIGLTQSGVSRQIKILEEFLGTSLFDRIGPRLILTDAGSSYAAEIERVLNDIEKISIDVVRGWKSETALRVGALSSVASRWVAPRINRFLIRFPNTLFEIRTTHGGVDFSDTPLDLAILRGRGSWKSAHAAYLFKEQFVVVAAPSLIPYGTSLEPHRFREFQQLQNSRRPDNWIRWTRATGQTLSGALQGPRLGDSSMLINAAVSGIGIAVVPEFLVELELHSRALHTPFGTSVASGENYYCVYPERKAHRTTVLEFRDWILGETKSLRRT